MWVIHEMLYQKKNKIEERKRGIMREREREENKQKERERKVK